MRKKIILLAGLLCILAVPGVYSQQTGNNQAGGNQQTGAAPDPLEKLILENFEEAEDWRARSTTPLGETKVLKMVQRGLMRDVFDENTVPDNGGDQIEKNHILGIKTHYTNRGFDRVEVFPPHEYVVKGKARQLSIWALGRKFRHTLFAKLRDYRGNTHNVRLGRLDYFGWRKLTATIPGYVPQSTRFALLDKNLHFVSLFAVSDVHEVGGQFYFYVDDLEIRADKSDAKYPGSEIKDNW